MFDRWIRAQRVGLAAYRLGLRSTRQSTSDLFRLPELALFSVRQFLESEISEAVTQYSGFIATLPPVVLHYLSLIPELRLGAHLVSARPMWLAAIERQRVSKVSAEPSKLVGARIVAHHILYGTATPVWVFRLAKSVFAGTWLLLERDDRCIDAMESLLQTLRFPWTDSGTRTAAIENASKALEAAAERLGGHVWLSSQWRHIENILYQSVFSWPLLVFAEGSGAISLPVAVETSFETPPVESPSETAKKIAMVGAEELCDPGWEPSLQRAVDAAKIMWRGKHGNYGAFRESVQQAKVTFDFSTAQRIVAEFPETVRLSESSMEAYFSQIALSRFLGNRISSASVVTGRIGGRRMNEIGGFSDFEYRWPHGIVDKLKYAFRSQFFERAILPDPDDLDENDSRLADLQAFLRDPETEQTAEINFVKNLQNVADSFQIDGWRQFRYIRCPDLSWRIHPAAVRLPSPETDGVRQCLAALRQNDKSVLELDPGLDAVDLASALWHINLTLRNSISIDRPPMFSWAFVRSIPEEQDTRFWHVITRVCGASMEQLTRFRDCDTSESAAKEMADILNRMSPDYTFPSHRAPDIIVVVDSEHLSANVSKTKNKLVRSHSFDAVSEILKTGEFLLPNHYSGLRHYLGNTRLIVVKRQVPPSESSEAGRSLNHELVTAFEPLRAFRFGFTQQMAAILWRSCKLENLRTREVLTRLVVAGALRYGSGEYHIPGEIGLSTVDTKNPVKKAQMQFAAAVALAPYLSINDVPGLAFDKAFQPEYVHEAGFHLSESNRALHGLERNAFRQTVLSTHLRLQRFAEYPTWNAVRNLLMSGSASKDAYEIAEELLSNRSASLQHPEALISASRAAERRRDELKSSEAASKHSDEINRLDHRAEELLDFAEKACERPELQTEHAYNRLRVITQRVLFLHNSGRHLADNSSIRTKLADEAWMLSVHRRRHRERRAR